MFTGIVPEGALNGITLYLAVSEIVSIKVCRSGRSTEVIFGPVDAFAVRVVDAQVLIGRGLPLAPVGDVSKVYAQVPVYGLGAHAARVGNPVPLVQDGKIEGYGRPTRAKLCFICAKSAFRAQNRANEVD